MPRFQNRAQKNPGCFPGLSDPKMVRSSRFERPAHGFGDHCSIQLSYERKFHAHYYNIRPGQMQARFLNRPATQIVTAAPQPDQADDPDHNQREARQLSRAQSEKHQTVGAQALDKKSPDGITNEINKE